MSSCAAPTYPSAPTTAQRSPTPTYTATARTPSSSTARARTHSLTHAHVTLLPQAWAWEGGATEGIGAAGEAGGEAAAAAATEVCEPPGVPCMRGAQAPLRWHWCKGALLRAAGTQRSGGPLLASAQLHCVKVARSSEQM